MCSFRHLDSRCALSFPNRHHSRLRNATRRNTQHGNLVVHRHDCRRQPCTQSTEPAPSSEWPIPPLPNKRLPSRRNVPTVSANSSRRSRLCSPPRHHCHGGRRLAGAAQYPCSPHGLGLYRRPPARVRLHLDRQQGRRRAGRKGRTLRLGRIRRPMIAKHPHR